MRRSRESGNPKGSGCRIMFGMTVFNRRINNRLLAHVSEGEIVADDLAGKDGSEVIAGIGTAVGAGHH